MSLLKTKPRWCESVATEQGWVNSISGELLVSLRGLKSKLEAQLDAVEAVIEQVEPIVEDQPTEVVEQIMEQVKEPVVEEVQLKEQTYKKLKKNQKVIAEVVEYDLPADNEVIGE